MRRIAAGLIVIMSVLLVSCKGKTGNTITVGSDKLDNTQSYFSESMHTVARCDTGYYYLDKCSASDDNLMMISQKKALCYVINHNVGMMEKSAWHIFQEASLKVSCITIIRTYI